MQEWQHEIARVSRIGTTHQKNQDAVGAWTWNVSGTAITLLAVADGVSAGLTSEVASLLTLDMLHDGIANLAKVEARPDEFLKLMIGVAEEASKTIEQRTRGETDDATTLACACCIGAKTVGLWVGDSRAYLAAQGETLLVTRDHSWAEGVLRRGEMDSDEVSKDPRARMITRWLGPQGRHSGLADTFELDMEDDNTLVCCSDGLSVYFEKPHGDEDEIGEILHSHEDLAAGLAALEAVAAGRGGRDDISVAAMRLHKIKAPYK